MVKARSSGLTTFHREGFLWSSAVDIMWVVQKIKSVKKEQIHLCGGGQGPLAEKKHNRYWVNCQEQHSWGIFLRPTNTQGRLAGQLRTSETGHMAHTWTVSKVNQNLIVSNIDILLLSSTMHPQNMAQHYTIKDETRDRDHFLTVRHIVKRCYLF